MIDGRTFLAAAASRGFGLYAGVPCSYLKPLINLVIDGPALRYVGAANEGDAVAVVAGAELGGRRGVVMFQNSGLGNAVSPLTSLTHVFRIPMLLITTLRGEPGGRPDEPQHEVMGRITTDLLDLMGVRWERFPTSELDVGPVLDRALAHMDQEALPYALVMGHGSVAPAELGAQRASTEARPLAAVASARAVATRGQLLAALQGAVREGDVVLASTGYTGRELYALDDRPSQLYMVGSMGCASSLGLGLALARPERRIIVVEGDGAALMRLGALCSVGHEAPPNLVHVLLDNGLHESTGGQATLSSTVSFPGLAAAAGYGTVASVATGEELAAELGQAEAGTGPSTGPAFIHAPILSGVAKDLPRPTIKPHEVAARLRRFLGEARRE